MAALSQMTGLDVSTPFLEVVRQTDNLGTFGPTHVRVNLAAADINGMSAAPVLLVPAPGAGKTIAVRRVVFTITRTSTAFANGGVVIVQYDNTATGGGQQALDSTIAASVITGSAGTTVTCRNGGVLSDIAAANIQNKGLYISNQTAAFTTGTGTAVVDVFFSVVQ